MISLNPVSSSLPPDDGIVSGGNVLLDGVHEGPRVLVVLDVLEHLVHADLQHLVRLRETEGGY